MRGPGCTRRPRSQLLAYQDQALALRILCKRPRRKSVRIRYEHDSRMTKDCALAYIPAFDLRGCSNLRGSLKGCSKRFA